MRSFIVSILLLLVILGCWVGFDMYSDSRLDSYIDSIEAEIMPHIESENWQNAAASLEMLEKIGTNTGNMLNFFSEQLT